MRKLESQYRTAKEAAESEVGALAAQAEQMRTKAGALRGAATVIVADSDERLLEMQSQYDAHVRCASSLHSNGILRRGCCLWRHRAILATGISDSHPLSTPCTGLA